MIKQMIIVRGLPGSGKSLIAEQYKQKHKDSCFVCATDEYWVRPDNIYDFNILLLGNSHVWNRKRVEEILKREKKSPWDTLIVVDNTNVNFGEIRPYAVIAKKHKLPLLILEPKTKWRYDVAECFNRNTHGVPYATILKMYHNWEPTELVMSKLVKMGCEVI